MPHLDRVRLESPADEGRQMGASIVGLVAGNVLLAASVFLGDLGLAEVVWAFWAHSVVIGGYHYVRMMKLQDFSTEGMTFNDRPVPETPAGRRNSANFFLMHYGIFHAAYLGFLFEWGAPGPETWPWLTGGGLGFLAGEHAAYRRHVRTDATWRPNLGTMMMQPYLRIVPMHLTILGGRVASALIFLPLKLAADVGSYLVDEHMDAERARSQKEAAAQGPSGRSAGL